MSLIHNERLKLLATAPNSLGVGSIRLGWLGSAGLCDLLRPICIAKDSLGSCRFFSNLIAQERIDCANRFDLVA
jgi:hypothetical protein